MRIKAGDELDKGSFWTAQKQCSSPALLPGVGLGAVNDALLLDVFVEDIIRGLYPGHPQVDRLCDAYRKSKRITLLGQLLDTASVGDVNAFTWDRYEQLVAFKTSHYSYFHPMEMAMLVSDRLDNHPILRQLAYRIGFLFQSQVKADIDRVPERLSAMKPVLHEALNKLIEREK
ncbi:hypothetical protein ANCDUO_20735 [Ancylostoma duodenale]|uniref:Uncharacterized protein n=1 Tax=Ancylostoma duodenale TaxID=51022 RepID=A0A0C2FW66_9BILA|nr:hypothetical protein ANCDUO_20735 [Ancylostoma duodenale]